MNEDLLEQLYNKYNLSSKGDLGTFISDMQNPEVAEGFYFKYLEKQGKGTVEQFIGDLGLEYTPMVARPPKKTNSTDALQQSVSKLNTSMASLNTSVGKLNKPKVEKPSNSFYDLDSKVKPIEDEVDNASDSFLESAANFGSAIVDATKEIGNRGFIQTLFNSGVKDREEEQLNIEAANLKKAEFYNSLTPEYLKPLTYGDLYMGEANFSTTREEAVRKTNSKLAKHESRLREALHYKISNLTEPEQRIAVSVLKGEEVEVKDTPSPQLEEVLNLAESHLSTKYELDNNVGFYNEILKGVTSVIGEAKNNKLGEAEIKSTAIDYLEVLKESTPIDQHDKIDDIIKLTEETMAVGGGNDQLLRSWMTGTMAKLFDTGEALIKGVKANFYTDAVFNLTREDVEDVAKDSAGDVIRTALQEPRSAYTGSISEEVVDKGGRRLVVKDGQVVDIRRVEDNSKIFFPSKEDIAIAESFDPNKDKTRKDYRGKSILNTTGQVISDMVPMIGISAATGGSTLGIMLGSTSVSYGSYYKQALETTGDMKRATLFAAITAPLIGYVESKIGNLESKLGRTLSAAEKKGIYNTITTVSDDIAREGIEAYIKGLGIIGRVQKGFEKSLEIGNDVKGELFEEFSNFPVEALAGTISGVKTQPISTDDIEETIILTTLASGFMSGANVMLNNKNDINELLGYAATRKDQFNKIAEEWVNVAPTPKEKEARTRDVSAKKAAVNEVEDTFKYIEENIFDDKAKDKLTSLTLDKARALYKLSTADSSKTKAVLQSEIDKITKEMDGILPTKEEEAKPAKTFINRDISDGKKIYSDFDNTLYNPKTRELTAVGEELRAKLNSGELTPEDVEILTARSADEAVIIKKLFPELKITSDLSPEGKAAKVAESNGNSIFIDDNKENLAAAKSGEVIDAATVVPQTPKEVDAEKVAEQKETESEVTKKVTKKVTNKVTKKDDAVNDAVNDAVSEGAVEGVTEGATPITTENVDSTAQTKAETKSVAATSPEADVDIKEQQLQIINSTNPAPNTTNTWVRSVDDIKTPKEAFKAAFDEGNMYPDFTTDDMQNVLDSGEVTVYSSKPIKEGVFVTPSKMNAQEYSGGKDGKVYSKKVKAEDVAWIDEGEGQYAPIPQLKKQATQNSDNKNWREAYKEADPYRKSDILRNIGEVSKSDKELSDVLDMLVKGAPNEGSVAWEVANNPNSSKETFENAVSNKSLRKSTSDENIQSLREKRFGKAGSVGVGGDVGSKLEKPYKTVNDGSGKMVKVVVTTTEKNGVKTTKFKTQTTNKQGESREQNAKGFNTFEEAVENLGIDLKSEENESALELIQAIKESQGKENIPVSVTEIREGTDKSSPFYGKKVATLVVGGEQVDVILEQSLKETPKAETPKVEVGVGVGGDVEVNEGFTEGKDLNKIYAGLKAKYGDKKGATIYEAAIRLVNPNKNTIIEIRGNGVVVKEGGKYILKPFGNTDANSKNWTLYKGLDVTDQFTEEQPTSTTRKTPNQIQQTRLSKNKRVVNDNDVIEDGTTYTTEEDITLLKGKTGKRDEKGNLITAHPNVKGSFFSLNPVVAQEYARGEGGKVIEQKLPKGTTVEVVNVDQKQPLSKIRKEETDLINNSNADVVKLVTMDGKGMEVQYIIPNKSKLNKNEKESSNKTKTKDKTSREEGQVDTTLGQKGEEVTNQEKETILEPLGKDTKAREEQIYKFFALPATEGNKTKARELAKITNTLWENIAVQLGKRSKLAADAWIKARVAMMGKLSMKNGSLKPSLENAFDKLRKKHKDLYKKFPDFDFIISRVFDVEGKSSDIRYQEVKNYSDVEFYNTQTKELFGGKELNQLTNEDLWSLHYIKKNNISPKKFKNKSELDFFIESELNKLKDGVNNGTFLIQDFTSEDAQALADSYGETGSADRAMMLDAVENESTRKEILKQTQDRQRESFSNQLNHFTLDGIPKGMQLVLAEAFLKNDYRLSSEINVDGRKGNLETYKKYLLSQGKTQGEVDTIIEKANNKGLISKKIETFKRKPNTINAFHEFDFSAVADNVDNPKTTNIVNSINNTILLRKEDNTYVLKSKPYEIKKLSDGVRLFKIPKGDLAAAEIIVSYSEATKEVMSSMPWCTNGKSKSESVITNGDVYFMLDKNNKPIIQVTYNSDGSLEQLGGVGSNQSIRIKDSKYTDEVKDVVPNIEGEFNRIKRDKLLYSIIKNNYELSEDVTKEDVKWLLLSAPKGSKYESVTKDYAAFKRNLSKELVAEVFDIPKNEVFIEGDEESNIYHATIIIGNVYGYKLAPNNLRAKIIIGDADFRGWTGSANNLTTIGGNVYFRGWTGSANNLTTIGGSADFHGWTGSANNLTTIGGNVYFRGWTRSANNLTTIGGNVYFHGWTGSANNLTTIGGDANFQGWTGSANNLTTIGGDADFHGWTGSANNLTTIGGNVYFRGWTRSANNLTTIGGDADFRGWTGSANNLTTIGGNADFHGWTGSANNLTTIGGDANFQGWTGSANNLTTIGGEVYFDTTTNISLLSFVDKGYKIIYESTQERLGKARLTGSINNLGEGIFEISNKGNVKVGEEKIINSNIRFQSTQSLPQAASAIANNLKTELDRMIKERSNKENIKARGWTTAQAANQVRELKAVKAELENSMKDLRWQVEETDKNNILDVFHGTSKDKDFKKFKDSGKGIFVTTDSGVASDYATQNDSMKFGAYNSATGTFEEINTASRVIPMKVELGNSYKITPEDLKFLNSKPNYSSLQKELHNNIKNQGFDSIDYGKGVYAILTENRLKSLLTNEVLFSSDSGKFRAAAIELANGQMILASLDAPNASSFVHEMSHSFEKDLTSDERQTFIDEYNEVFGQKDDNWSTDVSEYFARTWEKYLSNGRKLTSKEIKDPTRRSTIQDIFDKFTDYLQGIYNGIIEYTNTKGVKKEINVSPAVQSVFDKIMGIKEVAHATNDSKSTSQDKPDKTATKDIKEAETNLRNAAKEFAKAWITGDKNLGIIFDPKAAAISKATATKNFFNALVEYIKAKVGSGYSAADFKKDVEGGKLGEFKIDDNGIEYLFDEVLNPGNNREQVKTVNQLRSEIENLYDQFEKGIEQIKVFADKVNNLLSVLGKQQHKSGNNTLFTTSEVKNLIDKANGIRTEEDLKEFESDLESLLEDKEIKKFRNKLDKAQRLAKKRVKALKSTDSDLKTAVLFNPRDRTFKAEDAKNDNADLKRFNNFINSINNQDIAKDKNFLSDKEYFADKRREQVEAVASKKAIKKTEFDADGNIIENGEIIHEYADLPKEYKEEFKRRQMKFDKDGNLIDDTGRVVKNNADLSNKEKEQLARINATQTKIKNKVSKEESDVDLKEELLEEARELRGDGRTMQSDEALQSLSDKFLDLTDADLNSLSVDDLATLIAGYKTLRDTSILQDTYEQLLSKAKEKGVVDNTLKVLNNSSGSFRALLRDLITFKGKTGKFTPQKMMERFLKNTPLTRIDAILKGKDGNYFYNTFANPLAVGFGHFTAFNNKLKSNLRSLSRGVSQKDSLKLMLYAIDKQYRNNPNSEELNSVAEEIKNASLHEDENYKVGDFAIVKEIYEELLKEMGGEFDYRKMDAATTGPLAINSKQRRLIEYVENLGDTQAGKVLVTAARTNKETKVYKNYIPLDRVSSKSMGDHMRDLTEETIDADNFNMDSPSTPGNVNARIKSNKPIRNWNFVTSSYNSAKKTELDYQVRQPLKDLGNSTKAIVEELNKQIATAKKDGNTDLAAQLKAYKDFVSAVRVTIKDIAKDNLITQFDELTDTDVLTAALTETGYGVILASPARGAAEFVSNLLFGITAYPMELAKGVAYLMNPKNIKNSNSNLDELISLVPTTQSSRLLQHTGSLYRDQVQDVRGFGATELASKARRIMESSTQTITNINNFLNSFGDKLVAKPMWFGSFENEFNRLLKEAGSKNTFDIDKYLKDEAYRFENKDITKKATLVADANLAQGFSSFNPFESIADLSMNKKGMKGVLETFKRFLQRFPRTEYQSAEDAVNAMVGRGSITPAKGAQLLTATIGRMALYTLIAKILADLFDDEVVRPAVNAVSEAVADTPILMDTEDDEEDWESKIKTAFLGSAIGLAFGRRMNAIMKLPINLGVEIANVAFGEELGLRKTEKYEAYKHSLVFSTIRIPNVEGFKTGDEDILFSAFGRDFREPVIKDMNQDAYLVKLIAGITGPFNPLIIGTADFVKDLNRDTNKDLDFLQKVNPHKEQAVRELIPWLSAAAAITSYVPLPAPRDIKRNIQQTRLAIQFGPDIEDPIYKKGMRSDATLTEKRDALKRLDEIRLEDVKLLEDKVEKFLESEDWQDILEETKNPKNSSSRFKTKLLNSKGTRYDDETEYFKRGSTWYKVDEKEDKEVKVSTEEAINQLEALSDFSDYRKTWERFMIEIHKMAFYYQVEPQEIEVGEFQFIPRGKKGTKLEQNSGEVREIKKNTRVSIKRYFK